MKQLYILILTLLLPAFAFASPNDPSDLTFTNVTSHSVTLNWQDNSEDETGFKILVNGKYLLKTAPEITHFTVGSLRPDTDYEFTVKATDFNDEHHKATISTDKQTYNVDEDIVVDLKNLIRDDANNWVGIYPKDASNDWNNKIEWERPKDGKTSITLPGIAAGEYEARLFYSSSFELLAKVGFSVNDYGSKGIYMDEVHIEETNDYIVYYPKNHLQGVPLVLFAGYYTAIGTEEKLRNEGVMRYIASLGCCVIGNKVRPDSWTDAREFLKVFNTVALPIPDGVNRSKFAIVGHSTGGMASYYMMKYFKSHGYGATKSFIINIDGWLASNMSKQDIETLDTDSLIISYGGYNGTADEVGNVNQDSRVLLTISHLLPQNVNKSFIVLPTKNHYYHWGEYEEGQYGPLKLKKDFLKPLDAMVKYEFFNEGDIYNNASSILFDNYNTEVTKTINATIDYTANGGEYDYECKENLGIDYCNDYN